MSVKQRYYSNVAKTVRIQADFAREGESYAVQMPRTIARPHNHRPAMQGMYLG